MNITIKLTKVGDRVGPFDISDDFGNVLGINITKAQLSLGVSYSVSDATKVIIVSSTGLCKKSINIPIEQLSIVEVAKLKTDKINTASLWRHLTNIQLYNNFYGNIEPYILEYPYSFQYNDEILQNVKDYTKAYKYLSIPDGVFNYNTRIETNTEWFNKAILYNGQQCSGMLELVVKPKNNLNQYLKYPLYSTNSKTITFTKSDNFYQFNTFWSLVKSTQIPFFNTPCSSLSIDKELNQLNMDYGKRSFHKQPLRAKDLKTRFILDNRSDVHLTSQFTIAFNQISYK